MLDHVSGQCTGMRSSAVFYDAVLALLSGRCGLWPEYHDGYGAFGRDPGRQQRRGRPPRARAGGRDHGRL